MSKSADVGLWKNAIGLVNTADYSEQYFVPHKDISVPPHPGRGVVDWATMGQGGATFDPYQRVKLAFLAGNEHRYFLVETTLMSHLLPGMKFSNFVF